MNANLKKRKQQKSRPAAWILPTFPDGTRLPLPPPIRKVLGQVRRRHLMVRLAEGLILPAIALPLLWLVQALMDWAFNLSLTVRFLFLLADAAIILGLLYKFVLVPFLRRLNQQTAALLIERSMPQFRTELISAVQLAEGGRGCIQSSLELVQRLLARVANKIGHLDVVRRVVSTSELRRRAKIFAGVVVVSAAAFGWFYPGSAILLSRILLSSQPLPTMTRVFPLSKDADIGAGSEIELSARAEGVIPKTGRVIIEFDDGRRETVTAMPKAGEPGVFAFTLPNARQAFRYHFAINDGASPVFRVTTRVLPALAVCRFTRIDPEYTGLGEVVMSAGNLSLLAGGKLRIEGEATQPLKSATLDLGGVKQQIPMEITGEGRRNFKAEIPVNSKELNAVTIDMLNEKGESSGPITTKVDVRDDKPPVASLILPKTEKITALVDSRINLAYSVKDDFGLKKVVLRFEVIRPTNPDQGQPPAESGQIPLEIPSGRPVAFRWDLSGMIPPLTIGSFVRYWIEAEDNNKFTGPGIGRSQKKSITIVSEEAKRMELLDQLGRKAGEIERLYKSQQKINDKTDTTIRTK